MKMEHCVTSPKLASETRVRVTLDSFEESDAIIRARHSFVVPDSSWGAKTGTGLVLQITSRHVTSG